jgi:hypothetical protein
MIKEFHAKRFYKHTVFLQYHNATVATQNLQRFLFAFAARFESSKKGGWKTFSTR